MRAATWGYSHPCSFFSPSLFTSFFSYLFASIFAYITIMLRCVVPFFCCFVTLLRMHQAQRMGNYKKRGAAALAPLQGAAGHSGPMSVVEAAWDRTKTTKQNFAALGLKSGPNTDLKHRDAKVRMLLLLIRSFSAGARAAFCWCTLLQRQRSGSFALLLMCRRSHRHQ